MKTFRFDIRSFGKLCKPKCDIKSPLETNVESMCKCYVVPVCKFHFFIPSIQGKMYVDSILIQPSLPAG